MAQPTSAPHGIPAGVQQLSGPLRDAIEQAIAHQRERRYREAEAAYRRILAEHPDQPDTLNLLAAMVAPAGGAKEAVKLLRRAVELRPDDIAFRANLAGLLTHLGRHDDALAEFAAVGDRISESTELAMNYAHLLRRLGRGGEAIEHYQKILARTPDFRAAMIGLGKAQAELGQADAAAASFRQAIERFPDDPAGYLELAAAVSASEDKGEIARMLELAGRTSLPSVERQRLLQAAGKMCEDLARYDEAFAHYAAAKALEPATYDPAMRAAAVDRLIAAFDAELFAALRGFGDPSVRPVFVLGLPRAGAPVVEKILAAHPEAAAAGELGAMGRVAQGFAHGVGSALSYPDAVRDLNRELAKRQAEKYLAALGHPASARVVDRAPGNIDHLGLIALLLPNARLIHCRRDPIAVCFAAFSSGAGDGQGHSRELRHLGHYHRQYERLMDHWRRVLPEEVLELRYEDFTAKPDAVARKLVQFTGLPWHDKCAAALPPARAAGEPARWKKFEKHLGPLIEALKA
jgi:tetratricopeptide (TPR) repeat protein